MKHMVQFRQTYIDTFPIQNGLQEGIALSPLFSNYALKFVII